MLRPESRHLHLLPSKLNELALRSKQWRADVRRRKWPTNNGSRQANAYRETPVMSLVGGIVRSVGPELDRVCVKAKQCGSVQQRPRRLSIEISRGNFQSWKSTNSTMRVLRSW